uniref:Myosin light chain kinase, smooth muscle n=1 Tax=Cacopsylla melanoneura TaxID=428564 RepID=A0A8D8WY19_9HEMI
MSKEKEHIQVKKKEAGMVDQFEEIESDKKEKITSEDTNGIVIWSSSVETSGTIETDLHSEDNTVVDKTRLKKNAVDFKDEIETITIDKEPEQRLNGERKKEKKISQFLPEDFKRQNGRLKEDVTSVPHPYRKEFSADVMAKKTILQELSSEGATGGDVEKAFYTNESALLDSKPKFSIRLQDKSATQGTTLCLSCSILYTKDSVKYAPWYAPDLVEWYKDGQNILVLSDFKRYRTFFCENTATLEIKDCKLTDSGQFTCLARNKYGRSSTSCNVKVYANLEPTPMGPVFSKIIKEHYKFLDDELSLECRVKCFPPAKITWLKDNIPIRPINRYYQTELSDGVCRLTICSPDQSDSGKYTCRAEHDVWTEHSYYFLNFQGRDYHTMGKVGRRSQSSGSLQVVEKHMWHPQKPSIVRGLLDDVVPSGGTLALHVQVQGFVKPEVIWLRGNTPLPKSSPRFKYIEDSNNLHTLILSGVTAEESGQYVCRVSNEYGYTETIAKVDVINVSSGVLKHEKPAMFLTRPDTMMSVSLGEDVSFSFRLSGSPKPKVTWMKGIRDITTSTRTFTETVNDYVRLTLKRATDDDNGTYFIVARNIYGSDRAFVTVRVRQRARSMNALNYSYKPEVSSIYQGIHENFKEQFNSKDVPEQISEPPIVSASGRNWLTLNWLKPQSDVLAPVLAYKVEAWKLGPDGGGFWNELGISATSSFDAFNLTPGAQYRFRVTPRNRYGWGESTMTNTPVTIGEHMGLPEFAEDLPGQLKVLVGSDVTLDGVVHSSTTPDIRWLKDGTTLQIEDNRLVTIFNGGKVSLTIHDLKQEDDGRYICEAVNKVGRVSSYARLMVVTDPKLIEADHGLRKITQEACPIVNTAPQFTMRLRDRRVQVSYPVRLTCQLVAYPAPTVSWYKDDILIFPDDRHDFITDGNFHTLEISHTELDDSGEYSVTASNKVGGSITCKSSLIVDKGIRGYISPEFTIDLPSAVTVREHGELKFSAHVEAYPCVGITWHRNGVKLRPTRRQVMTLDHDGNVDFTLVSVSAKEEGVYTCTASNEIGKVESHCTVTVQRETSSGTGKTSDQTSSANIPKMSTTDSPYSKEPRFIIKPTSTECVEGDTVEILCEVVGDPMPKVTWTRDWLKPDYYRDGQVFHQVGSDGQYRLEIPNVKLDYTGTYGVLAENAHGDTKAFMSLQVFAKGQGKEKGMPKDAKIHGAVVSRPKLVNGLENLRCCDGDSVVFECQIQMAPPNEHAIAWFRNNRLIKLDSDMKPEVQVDSTENLVIARLKIPHVYPEDEGEFTCRVANELGEVSTSACLIVDVPEEKENSLSVKLTRPSGLLSGGSTPRSTPRSTPPRSISPLSARPYSAYTLNTALRARRLTSSPRFYSVPHNKLCDLGDTVRFQCSVTGQPAPWTSWSKDGKPATPNARVTIREKEDLKIFEIAEVTLEDAGLYTIRIENNYGSVEATARLEIMGQHGVHTGTTTRSYSANRVSPSFRRRLVGSTARVGGQFTLAADIQASPSPVTSWYKNGELLVQSDKITPTWDGKVARLELDDLDISDSGVYTCIAENEIGKTRCSAELSVTPDTSDAELQPPVFEIGLPNRINIPEGVTHELSVKIAGSQPLDIVWSKDGVELVDCSDFKYVEHGDGQYGLRFLDTFHEDGGRYTCEAFNDHGDATTSTTLIVGETDDDDIGTSETTSINNKPSSESNNNRVHRHDDMSPATIIGRPTDVSVLRGSTAVLKTDFIGEPLPEIKWDKAGHDLKSDDRINIITVGGTSVLTIEEITGDDSGKYEVHVSNEHGVDCCYVSVAVEGIPDPPSGAIGVSNNGTSVVITWSSPPYDGGCMITGYVVEMRTGTQPWVKLNERCHSLSHAIHGLVPGQSYVFRVRAENVHGLSHPSNESQPVQVLKEIVEIPPFEPRFVHLEGGDKFDSQYQILEELGKGRYGTVHKVVEQKESGQTLAAKFVRCISGKDREKVHEEVDIMNSLRHPKLLQLFSAYENQKHVIMVMEYIGGGELFERVVADDFTLTERDCVLFLRQICEGVDYMHRNNIVHLDLKPENIMCVSRASHHIKIIDFGLAQKINPDHPPRVLFGTPEFIPPEIINYEPIGIESDMWSIGVITYVLLSGLSPFMGENDSETFANITRAEFDFDDEAFEALSEDAKDFISLLLVKRKEKRLTARQCLSHTWMAQKDSSPGANIIISTDKLKKFIIRRKWQKTGNALRALRKMGKMARERYESRRASTATTVSSSSSTSSSFGSPRPSMALSRMSSLNEDDTDLTAKLKLANETIEAEKTEQTRQETKKRLVDKNVRYSDELVEIVNLANEEFNVDDVKENKTNVKLKSIMKTNSKEYAEQGVVNEENVIESVENGTSSDTSSYDTGNTVIEGDTKLNGDMKQENVQNGITDHEHEIEQNGFKEELIEENEVEVKDVDVQSNKDQSGLKIVGSIDKLNESFTKDQKPLSNHTKRPDSTNSEVQNEKVPHKTSSLDKIKSLQDIRGRIRSDRSDSGFSESSVSKLDMVTTESKVQALSNKFKTKELKTKHAKGVETETEDKSKTNSLVKRTELFESLKTKQEDKTKKSVQNQVAQTKTVLHKRTDSGSNSGKNNKIDQMSKTATVRDQSPSRLNSKLKQFQNNVKNSNTEVKLTNKSPSHVILKNKVQENPFMKQQNQDRPLLSKLKTQTSQDNTKVKTPPGSPTTKAHRFFSAKKPTPPQIDKAPISPQNSRTNTLNNVDKLKANNANQIDRNHISAQNTMNHVDKLKSNNPSNVETSRTMTSIKSDHVPNATTEKTGKPEVKSSSHATAELTKKSELKSCSIFNRVHSKISNDLLNKFEQSQETKESKGVSVTGSQSKQIKALPTSTKLTNEDTSAQSKPTSFSSTKVSTVDKTSDTRVVASDARVQSRIESNLTRVTSTNRVETKLTNVFHTKQILNNNNGELINNHNVSCLDKTIKTKSTSQEHRLVEHEKIKMKPTFGNKETAGQTTHVHGSNFQKAVAFWKR